MEVGGAFDYLIVSYIAGWDGLLECRVRYHGATATLGGLRASLGARELEDIGKILGVSVKSKMIWALASVGLCSCIYSTMEQALLSLLR